MMIVMIMKKTWGESMIQVALALFDVRDHDHDNDVLDGKKS